MKYNEWIHIFIHIEMNVIWTERNDSFEGLVCASAETI